MSIFRTVLSDERVYVYDGAYGTFLQERGLPSGMSPELFGLEKPEVVRTLHEEYLQAGAQVLTTNTFGGTGPKLGKGVDVTALNREMAKVARQAVENVGREAYVSGSVGPTGIFVEPLGPLTMRELVALFVEQIEGLVQGGVDCIKLETMFDLAEVKAAVIATRQVCDLPIIASMTYEGEISLTGTPPETFVDTMQNMGVDCVASNCGAGPEDMKATVARMLPRMEVPLHLQPNAGLPELVGDKTVFRLAPEPFAEQTRQFVAQGAKFLGGCCGTGPAHIGALAKALQGATWQRPAPQHPGGYTPLALTTRSASVLVSPALPLKIIGERINPTGKKVLTAELQEGKSAEALRLAQEQIAAGAHILDVNVGAPMVNEADLLPRLAKELTQRFPLPLCLDTSDAGAMAEALWVMPGSPLVNSVSGEPGRMEELGPLCKLMGAPFILLPIKGRKLPVTAAERLEVIEGLLKEAEDLGIPKRLIMVDALALTVSSKAEAAQACFQVIRHCRDEWGLPTVLGLSNISFGLPARELVNSTFLTMCMAQGMAASISNPSSARLEEARAASEVLLARDPSAENFIAGYAGWKPGSGGGGGGAAAQAKQVDNPRDAVIAGARDDVARLVQAEMDKGRTPFAVVNEDLIPGIMEVGEKYEKKEYFLPQLMLSAETMQAGFDSVKHLLEDEAAAEEKVKIIMATVEGDIHDIGKNIVCLMLRNHGFEVLDLGKDVSAEKIVSAAQEQGAPVIGLSALMTTTMVRMQDVVDLAKEKGIASRIIVGGAVVTQDFADRIGAHGYAADAVAAVRLAKQLAQA